MRINQFLARSGLGSRRKVEALILDGSISVNSQVVSDLACNINPSKDEVIFEDKIISLPTARYLMLNKPAGYITTRSDPHAKKTVFELLPKDNSLICVGRLDKETTGLLLVTNDGDFAQKVIHPSQKIEKEYVVKLKNPNNQFQIKGLKAGVELEDGVAIAKKVDVISPSKITLVIEEGRNRIVRRMIAAVGNDVVELKRIRIGKITLDIPEGVWRELTAKEVNNYA